MFFPVNSAKVLETPILYFASSVFHYKKCFPPKRMEWFSLIWLLSLAFSSQFLFIVIKSNMGINNFQLFFYNASLLNVDKNIILSKYKNISLRLHWREIPDPHQPTAKIYWQMPKFYKPAQPKWHTQIFDTRHPTIHEPTHPLHPRNQRTHGI